MVEWWQTINAAAESLNVKRIKKLYSRVEECDQSILRIGKNFKRLK